MTKVAIIGTGPAALFAALGVEHAGHTPVIYGPRIKSKMFGAMYLHRAIPEITPEEPDFFIDVIKRGTREGYAYNVYGSQFASSSWEDIREGPTPAWSLTAAYDKLWERFWSTSNSRYLSRFDVAHLCHNYPLVLNSAPALEFCNNRLTHSFDYQGIWVLHGEGKHAHGGDMMYYNGNPWDGSFGGMIGHSWYRFSQINKYQAWEFSHDPRRDDLLIDTDRRTLSPGSKPLRTSCTCFLSWEGYRRIGRFGKWQKGVLTHHAYEHALEFCDAL